MKNVKRFALVLCLVALCVGMMGVTAFAAYAPVTATIPVEILLSGTRPETPDTFQVELTPADPANPMPAGTVDGKYVMDLVGASSGNFQITFDKHGIYTYTAKQLPLGNEDCYQDASVYTIVAQVINNSDYTGFDLVVVIYCNDEAEKPDGIYFVNRYANPTQAQFAATKTMDKKVPADGAFQFELVDAEGNVLEAVTNVAGDVVFSPIAYNKVGTYTYTIREVAGNNTKIIYDKSQYTVTVDVVKDANGDYQCSVSYALGDTVLEGIPGFANKTKPIVPTTGDTANIAMWGALMVAALAGILIVLLSMKKKAANK